MNKMNLSTHAIFDKVYKDYSSVYDNCKINDDKLSPELLESPDEYEYYVIEVGQKLRHYELSFNYLKEIPNYLMFKITNVMYKKGITNHSYLLYHIENYIIRIVSIYDRALKLVNAVYHIQNDERECTSNTILKNAHVSRSNLPNKMKELDALLSNYKKERHNIIHHQSYSNRTMRLLELYDLLLNNISDLDKRLKTIEIAKDIAEDIRLESKYQFDKSNYDLYKFSMGYLDILEKEYERNRKRLLLVTGYGTEYKKA